MNKLFVDIVFNAWLFNSLYLIILPLLGGKSWKEAIEHQDKLIVKAVWRSWYFWPAAQFVTYTFVPLQFQPLSNVLAGLVWQTYLNFFTNSTSS